MAPQLVDLALPDQQLVLTSFTHDTAFELGCALRQHFFETYPDGGRAGGPAVLISIRLMNGFVAFQSAAGDATTVGTNNEFWINAKFNTVRMMAKPSLRVQYELNAKGKKPEDVGLAFPDFAVAGGGYPIFIEECALSPIGAIIVSGLPQKEDHQLILDTMNSKCKHLLSASSKPAGGA